MRIFKEVNPRKFFMELAESGVEWENGIVTGEHEVTVTFRENTDYEIVEYIYHNHSIEPDIIETSLEEKINSLAMQFTTEKITNMQSNMKKDILIKELQHKIELLEQKTNEIKGGE